MLLTELARPDAVERALASLSDPDLRSAASRCLYDHGGIIEARHLERLGYAPDLDGWRGALERALLGTIMQSELTDVGLQFGPGSLVVFLDLTRHVLLPGVEVQPDEDPEPPGDVLADVAAIRTFIDHHSVRVTRDGTLYRATRRKMENELLSPGARPLDREDSLSWLLRFLSYAELVGPDQDGRMRTSRAWDDFDSRGPVARTELLLTYVHNDVKDAKGAFHQPRLRKILLQVLRDAGPSRWLSLRHLAILARNRYLMTLDRDACGARFQKRYKYAPIPPLAAPGILMRELMRFGAESLSHAGLLETLEVEEYPVAVRMTRMGAAVLGIAVEEVEGVDDGAMIVTADFEIVLFPDAGGIELIHEVGRFARREKADYSLHYRISERSVQEAVAGGLGADAILHVLRTHGRHDIPQNVEISICNWAADVQVLAARRTLLIEAPSKEALDAALKVKELNAIAVKRLNDTVIELSEDPSTSRVAEALRGQGFFLR
ncbi:MAG: helicase-associated domain-containing protein [Planctomycetes bacterium]|nr:helicase-associated domain-containing protein [Planctomycetota bacterium]